MEEKILEILEEECEEVIDYDGDDMLGDGVIDSFTLVSIVSEIENEFGIVIDAEYVIADNFKNKEAIIALVKRVIEENKEGNHLKED